jgi:hypothetical protein
MGRGAFAANYHAVPRMMRDIGIVVELSAGDADRLCGFFDPDLYVARDAARVAAAEDGVVNLVHVERLVKVDLIVRNDSESGRAELARRRRVSVEGHGLFRRRPRGPHHVEARPGP